MSFTGGATPQAILCEQDGPVGIIMLNRPQAMNTISRQLEAELHEALDRAERDPSVRAIVLAGAGGRAFSAGYDLSAQHDLETRLMCCGTGGRSTPPRRTSTGTCCAWRSR
ncbi:enoyl-CoA hydratase/isomerase family protein [Vineibacter terrae]|nr:enoyl-CoA hydratase/isomerase family protein [Vineibacter terrae]